MKKPMNYFAAAVLAAVSLGAAQAQSGSPSDAQIAGIVVAANTVDIEAGRLAETKTQNKEVKAFARQMIKDHSAVNQQASDLVKKLNVKPEDSSTSKSLKESGESMQAKLKKLSGKEFDKTYVDNEVVYHQTVIDALDKTLIPSAKNEELKNTLMKVRPAFVAHLEHAKHLQSSLK